jgi:hypothetical protein
MRCESLHPPVHGHAIDLDTALRQELLDVPIGQAMAQVPADRDRDHLRRNRNRNRRGRPINLGMGGMRSTHGLSLPQAVPAPAGAADAERNSARGSPRTLTDS